MIFAMCCGSFVLPWSPIVKKNLEYKCNWATLISDHVIFHWNWHVEIKIGLLFDGLSNNFGWISEGALQSDTALNLIISMCSVRAWSAKQSKGFSFYEDIWLEIAFWTLQSAVVKKYSRTFDVIHIGWIAHLS